MIRFRRRCTWWLIAISVGAAGGCAQHATVRQWQASVDQTMSEAGSADPSVLRAAKMQDGRWVFRVLGQADANESTDQVGVLVGKTRVAGRNWFVFLLGTVKDHELVAARVAAMSAGSGRWAWSMGTDDKKALTKYRDYLTTRWDRLHPRRAGQVQPGFVWPREGDELRMVAKDGNVTVREVKSGAAWSMTIAARGMQARLNR